MSYFAGGVDMSISIYSAADAPRRSASLPRKATVQSLWAFPNRSPVVSVPPVSKSRPKLRLQARRLLL